MVRTLTPRAQKGERTLLLPGVSTAEPWELWATGAGARCLQACRRPEELESARGAVLALPVGQVIALPLWLQETRADEFAGMIALQIEAHGLQPRGHEAVFSWSVVAQEEKRTLVLVGVLASSLPEEVETTALAGFELSARCWPLPADAAVFWLEQDRLVLAVTRGDQLACFHALAEAAFTERVVQEVTCILAALRMQEVIRAPARVVIWADATPGEAGRLAPLFGASVHHEARPVPALPGERWELTPQRVNAASREHRARRWKRRAAGLCVLAGVVALIAMAARFFLVSHDVAILRQWQADHATALAMVHDTTAAWQDLRPALDTRAYPLEILLHVKEALPNQQVHLTLFDFEGGHLLIQAEARNLTAAFDFLDRLKKSAPLAGFTWEMAPPHLLGNDVTQLQLEGTYASAY